MDNKPKEEQNQKASSPPNEDRSSPQGLNKILNAVRGYYDEAVDGFRDAKSRLGEETAEIPREQAPEPASQPPQPVKEYRPEPKGLHRQTPGAAAETEAVPPEPIGAPILRPMQSKETGYRYRNVLVIGGMDFIGAALVHQLNLGGIEEIVLADSINEATSQALPFLRFQEFLGPEELQSLAASNFRGLSSFSHIFQIGGWNTSNFALAKSLYATALKGGSRFIAVASASSLGSRPNSALLESWSLPTTFRPQNQEGVISTLFDRYALPKSVNKSYLSLKHYRLFGPGERPDDGVYGLIQSCYHQICSTGSVRLPAALQPGTPDGDRTHDFYYVLDAARLAVLLGQSPQASGVYELGSGHTCTAATLAETVFSVLGVPPSITWDTSLPFTPPSAEPKAASLQRITETGLPSPPHELPVAIGHYIATYLQTGLALGEDIEHSEPFQIPSAENKTSILLPRKRVRVASSV